MRNRVSSGVPAVPVYLHRLEAGIAALEALPHELIDRRTLEEALGVGKWTAWRIMKRCGAEDGPGNTLVCHQYASRQHKEVAREEQAEALLSSRFSSLPPGVDLAPGELRIAFSGTEEFLQKFGAVVFALRNDFERIQEFIDGAAQPKSASMR
jgi:hypothetical protein